MPDFYKQSLSCQIVSLREIYLKAFGEKKDGFYVDVGAHDGYYCSNTWGLAMAGWRGVCFEPMPLLAAKARAIYSTMPKVDIVEAAVGDHEGFATLYTDGNPTIDLETMQKGPWGPSYDPKKSIQVQLVTLDAVLARKHFPVNFDVLSIDVEGAELQVLHGIDFKRWFPKMVILETCHDHPIPSYHLHTGALLATMQENGFRETYHDAINSIYTRKHETSL